MPVKRPDGALPVTGNSETSNLLRKLVDKAMTWHQYNSFVNTAVKSRRYYAI